ncbi:MAG TPA: helix-turn-helix domain-containing protein [Streptosporangiaceae bacterium]
MTGLAAAGPGPARPEPGGARLRVLRQARGYSQQQLAGMAGVSRQAVSAVEAGHSDPSLRVALALASALGVTVEELFGPGVPAPVVGARPVAPLGEEGARVTLAQVGDSFVALPLAADSAIRAGFLPAGGLVAMPSGPAPVTPVRPLGPPRPTLVVAGCDPALPTWSSRRPSSARGRRRRCCGCSRRPGSPRSWAACPDTTRRAAASASPHSEGLGLTCVRPRPG